MKRKRQELDIKNTASMSWEPKSWKTKGGSVFLEGFANRAVVDRGNDIIPGDAWDIENYKQNPVILVNHGYDPKLGALPVGRAVKIAPSKDGLQVKLRISNSQTEDVTRVRDLVAEGILTAMSVGFDPKDAQKEQGSGVNTITKAELYEISLVGVPMNQASVGEASIKSVNGMKAPQIKSILDGDINEVRASVCFRKGAWVAGSVHMAIYDLMKRQKVSRDQIIEKLLQETDGSLNDLINILAGNTTPVPEEFLDAFGSVLGMDREDLNQLDKGDVEVEHNAQTETQSESQSGQASGEKREGSSEEEDSGESKEHDQKQTAPDRDLDREELKKRLQERSEEFGIEILEDANLTYPSGYPEDLRLYGDPVNLRYPIDTQDRARNAAARWAQNYDEYNQESSRRVITNRIVERELNLNINPSTDFTKDPWKLVSQENRDKIESAGKGRSGNKKEDKNDNKEEEKQSLVMQTLILSKDRFKSLDQAKEWVTGNNFRDDKVDETENSYRFRQRDPGDFVDNSFRTVPITDGVQAVMGHLKEGVQRSAEAFCSIIENLVTLLSNGTESSHAVPLAIIEQKNLTSEVVDLSKKHYEILFDVCDSYKQAEQEDVSEPTTALQTSRNADDFGSPYIDLMKQTNVLLGTLINEIQLLRAQVGNFGKNESTPQDSTESNNSDTMDLSIKEEELVRKCLSSFHERLKNLGV